MHAFLLVAVGGATGAVLRYAVGLLLGAPRTPSGAALGFPRATLCVNLLGCWAAGYVLAQLAGGEGERRELLRLFLVVGVCGGFTTFSAFGVEAVELLRRGQGGLAGLYVALSVTLGLAAAALGFALGTRA